MRFKFRAGRRKNSSGDARAALIECRRCSIRRKLNARLRVHVPDNSGRSGKLDLICEHLQFLFPARAQGHAVRCLAACQNRSVEEMLARKGVDSIRDLRGKTVAIRSISLPPAFAAMNASIRRAW